MKSHYLKYKQKRNQLEMDKIYLNLTANLKELDTEVYSVI